MVPKGGLQHTENEKSPIFTEYGENLGMLNGWEIMARQGRGEKPLQILKIKKVTIGVCLEQRLAYIKSRK